MNLNRKFQHRVGEGTIDFDVTYDLDKHNFVVLESGDTTGYRLAYDMESKTWRTLDGQSPSIPVAELALLVQQNFGHFV